MSGKTTSLHTTAGTRGASNLKAAHSSISSANNSRRLTPPPTRHKYENVASATIPIRFRGCSAAVARPLSQTQVRSPRCCAKGT